MRPCLGLFTVFWRVACERQLSAEDLKTYRGTLTPEDNDGRQGQHMMLVHIPKTAGGSFLEDSPGFMKRSDVLVGNKERSWWYTREIQQVAAEAMVGELRHARVPVPKRRGTPRHTPASTHVGNW